MDEFEAETHLIEEHWRQIGVSDGWKIERVRKLAAKLGLTPVRLGMLVGLKPHEFRRMEDRGHVSRVVAVHFALIESFMNASKKPVIPFDVFT